MTPMPTDYKTFYVGILCKDCHKVRLDDSTDILIINYLVIFTGE